MLLRLLIEHLKHGRKSRLLWQPAGTMMGIGTLTERALHATLKRYLQPDEAFHEVSVGRYVADIALGDEIIEIQTRGMYRMLDKLTYFLKDHRVTVVYPVSHRKRIIWIDPETGEQSVPRKSNRIGSDFDIFYELTGLKPLLCHENLQFRVIQTDVDEYRMLDGWSRDRKRGAHRAERIPKEIVSDRTYCTKSDWSSLLPDTLADPFTVKELAAHRHVSPTCASRACICLTELGIIKRCGKRRNAYLYCRAMEPVTVVPQ